MFVVGMLAYALPVRSIIGGRTISITDEEAVSYTAADYIQDGLIALWDGIENAGWGDNDKTKNTWVNLITGVATAVTSSGLRQWSDTKDALEVPASVSVSTSAQLNFFTPVSLADQARSIEIVFYRTVTSSQQVIPLYHLSSNYTGIMCALFAEAPPMQRAYLCLYRAAGSNAYLAWRSDSWVGVGKAGATWSNNCRLFCNYMSEPNGGICVIRFYNRNLTAQEIAYNYAIDKVRFGL